MDPNANLLDQEELLQEISEYADDLKHPARKNAVDDLREQRNELRRWLSLGGFEPDWTQAPNARKYYGR